LRDVRQRTQNAPFMIINLCPRCRHVSATDAQRCEACGFDLDEADTQPLPLRRLPGDTGPGALWLDELGSTPAPPAPAAVPAAPPLSLTLRDIQPPAAPVVSPLPVGWRKSALVAADPEAPQPDRDAWVRVSDDAPLGEVAARAAKKIARRAAVRHARLSATSVTPGSAAEPPKMLVLDADGAARTLLCELLRSFGFDVYPVPDTARARALVGTRPFAAIFANIALDAADEGAGIELCRQVRQDGVNRGGDGALLVLVASRLSPVDRVRADLAGCAEAILKPVTRGSVARVLDTHGIALPTDARHA
jgi:CheY-like chemotaxis protein